MHAPLNSYFIEKTSLGAPAFILFRLISSSVFLSQQDGTETEQLTMEKLARRKNVPLPTFPPNIMQVNIKRT